MLKTLTFTNGDTVVNANAKGSTIGFPGFCPGKLKMGPLYHMKECVITIKECVFHSDK